MARIRRGATGISGIVAIDKPLQASSHDIVNRIRSLTGEGRVGHAGTLDPLASGLLLVCVGPATRLTHYLIKHDKVYLARIVFGSATTTDDAEGEVIDRSLPPEEVRDAFYVASFLKTLLGQQVQLPPAYSAIKKNGQTAYKLARKGEAPELEPRSIIVEEATLEGISEQCWDVRFSVSAGTYIRALARDIGRAMGTHAHLGSLRRIRSGNVDISQAFSLDQLQDCNIEDFFIDPASALGLPVATVAGHQAEQVRLGKALSWDELGAVNRKQMPARTDVQQKSQLISVVEDNELLAIYRADSGSELLLAEIVLSGGVRGVR